ncbi:putative exported protein [Halobacteriovorax marinus SJ]|uniref:Exported protein n=1 Tax=Halobacteriovorax marinus (strain ATCC BAA-682 / DSM 15412 / SJ) TaxID=862908 RepID=E1X5N2_HALMS|nr:hypothetical protein [Halobacteriovorax marinus]CBW25599.1 putative exported protein [Halobacteriovorax marinus SJ]
MRILLILLFSAALAKVSFADSKKYQKNYYYKGMNKSLVEWEKLDPIDFLDYDLWLRDVKLRDKWPEWEKTVREKSQREIVGKVLHCVGKCRFYRGIGFYNGQFRSTVLEGDEIHTDEDSYAWVFLVDGTMVRLSPYSSVTFKEFNIGEKTNFIHARINSGNILWLSREQNKFVENNDRETDGLFLPMKFYDALPTSESNSFKEDDLISSLEESQSTLNQYKRLNKLIEENNKNLPKRETFSFLVTPNGSISGQSLNVEFISLIGNKGYLKRRSFSQLGLAGDVPERSANFYFRGFENKSTPEIAEGTWYEIGEKGREFSENGDNRLFQMGELVTKRIPTIYVARELLLKEYSQFFKISGNAKKLAHDYGYRQWGSFENPKSDLRLRFEFLKEYSRRMETSNLLASERLREKMKATGGISNDMVYSSKFFNLALVEYMRGENINLNIDSEREVLNSTKKKFWKIINEIK